MFLLPPLKYVLDEGWVGGGVVSHSGSCGSRSPVFVIDIIDFRTRFHRFPGSLAEQRQKHILCSNVRPVIFCPSRRRGHRRYPYTRIATGNLPLRTTARYVRAKIDLPYRSRWCSVRDRGRGERGIIMSRVATMIFHGMKKKEKKSAAPYT